MSIIIHAHYIREVDLELEHFAPDILFDSGTRNYFSLYKDGQKIGYKSEALVYNPRALLYWEDTLVKMNLAGMSREVFIQSVVSIDSTRVLSQYLDFTLRSGSHVYSCKGIIQSDSLIIEVKNNIIFPWRKGVFIVDENTTFPGAIPYYMHRSDADTMDISVFDPIVFEYNHVHTVREGRETIQIKDERYDTVKYNLSLHGRKSSVWLDENGRKVKSAGAMFFSGELGDIDIERATDREVFMLPIEVSLGNDEIKSTAIYPDEPILDPRKTQYLEVRIDGIRAANIDVSASNKEYLSSDPVIFGIHNRPLLKRGRKTLLVMRNAEMDTSIVGTSDYIQSKDARIIRLARTIVESEPDTLTMARAINRWVHDNMTMEQGLDITRSIDILRTRRGFCDEYTKLCTAMLRSIGIPAQINMGLLYYDGAFRYHSWPSIYSEGVWHDLDPTLGQDTIDATHIALISGDFERAVELLRVMGRMSISILDCR